MLWLIWGVVYIGIGAATLAWLRDGTDGIGLAGSAIGAVIATDVGAYFAGRTIGGPRIAPSISPSKTWAGLGGGRGAGYVAHDRPAGAGCIRRASS